MKKRKCSCVQITWILPVFLNLVLTVNSICELIVSWWIPLYLSCLFKTSGLLFRGSQEMLTFSPLTKCMNLTQYFPGWKKQAYCVEKHKHFLQVFLHIVTPKLKLLSDLNISDLIWGIIRHCLLGLIYLLFFFLSNFWIEI